MTDTDPKVTGIVLAGGRSTRFRGGNKATATLDGEPFLERVVSVLTAATGRPPVVAVRTEEQRQTYDDVLSKSVNFAFDSSEFEGPLAGLFAAVDTIGTPWAFVCACDMPLLSQPAVEWLLSRAPRVDGPETPPAAVAVCHPGGTAEPLHTLYRRTKVMESWKRVSRTDGPRSLLATLDPVLIIPREQVPTPVPLDRSMTNINTRDELAAVVPSTVGIDD